MFIDEPEGFSFSDLNEYLGAASALGTAINIKLSNGKSLSGYLNHSQESLPDYIELFDPIGNGVDMEITKVLSNQIIWFKLKRYGRTESYINDAGVPEAKLPIVVIMAKKIKGSGMIINPGITSIYGEKIDFSGEIKSKNKNKEKSNE
ncbi:hypothetical protein IPM65_04765 [Candidatus Roizmanbacteria bacterium]|nr:MAG: hypothetical protein IPM65_04765 [Candidatus Roizmanbacteria bacterium]